ncbi:MAG: hypothetical protein NZ519_07070 [Bacteroidia bacterium]|nr:hypothetical protein [Bacteroidia bacterium]MDW8301333.1 hypothetical protein [Bacteroidia bacterium]
MDIGSIDIKKIRNVIPHKYYDPATKKNSYAVRVFYLDGTEQIVSCANGTEMMQIQQMLIKKLTQRR